MKGWEHEHRRLLQFLGYPVMKLWSDIPGWYDFGTAYEEAVKFFPWGTFVEVGCYLGRSLCHLGSLAKESGKQLRVVGVDTCTGTGPENGADNHDEAVAAGGGTFAGQLHRNIVGCGLGGAVDLMVMGSVRASEYFPDRSLSLVFIDAAHDYDSVRADILAWLPKVRPGGWVGGDDFGIPGQPPVWPGVRSAVMTIFGDKWEPWSHDSWRVRL